MRLNAFLMNSVVHLSPGLWRHPRDRSTEYRVLSYWTELAKTLERGRFDGIFIADVLGVYDVFDGGPDVAIRSAAQVPINDPMMLVSAMAAVTQHLGFGITHALTIGSPHLFARSMSTLDHLTGGRVGWNIVTGFLDSAARATGAPKQVPHDDRYIMAEEYMDLMYKLWERSWEDDAVVRDRVSGVFARTGKVHKVKHEGEHFKLDAIHLSEPSPQRTPVLYQAGASSKGMTFAARHAECVFMAAPTKLAVTPMVAALRKAVVETGRDPASVLIFTLMTVIVAPTDAEARAKLADFERYADHEGALALLSGWMGVDLARYERDEPLSYVETEAMQTAVSRFTTADPTRIWTVGEMARFVSIGGPGPVVVGSPSTNADELVGWMADTGVDGFNLAYTVMPECFDDFVDLVVPELQRRGVYKWEYAPGTLREKLFAETSRLPLSHPASTRRRP